MKIEFFIHQIFFYIGKLKVIGFLNMLGLYAWYLSIKMYGFYLDKIEFIDISWTESLFHFVWWLYVIYNQVQVVRRSMV